MTNTAKRKHVVLQKPKLRGCNLGKKVSRGFLELRPKDSQEINQEHRSGWRTAGEEAPQSGSMEPLEERKGSRCVWNPRCRVKERTEEDRDLIVQTTVCILRSSGDIMKGFPSQGGTGFSPGYSRAPTERGLISQRRTQGTAFHHTQALSPQGRRKSAHIS